MAAAFDVPGNSENGGLVHMAHHTKLLNAAELDVDLVHHGFPVAWPKMHRPNNNQGLRTPRTVLASKEARKSSPSGSYSHPRKNYRLPSIFYELARAEMQTPSW